jgi:hypothetical protein
MVATSARAGQLEQDTTIAAIREIGEAYEAWRADQSERANAEDSPTPASDRHAQTGEDVVNLGDLPVLAADELGRLLVPRYLTTIPRVDGWGGPIELRGSLQGESRLAIRSAGRDGVFEGAEYTPRDVAEAAFDEDVVWVDGLFVRQPSDRLFPTPR